MEPSFGDMAFAEGIRDTQDLRDRIAEESEAEPVREAQRLELRRRVDMHQASPDVALAREQVLARARAR
jgi:putative addiction module component (TIGR02574 family)